MVGIAVVVLLVLLAVRELDLVDHLHSYSNSRLVSEENRPPPSPTPQSSPMEIAQYDIYRLVKHLNGQYVFPPVQYSHPLRPSNHPHSHRRSRTLSGVEELENLGK